MGLDSTERQLSFVAGVFGLAIAIFTGFLWARNSPTISKKNPVAGGGCPTGYHLVNSTCEKVTHVSQGAWEFRFFFIAIVSLLILFFTWRKKRAGVATFAFFMGLGNGAFFGPLYLFLGMWLVIRAFRLQRYGDPSFRGSGKIAREQAEERKKEREAQRRGAPVAKARPDGRSTPTASKRYTPKKSSTRRTR